MHRSSTNKSPFHIEPPVKSAASSSGRGAACPGSQVEESSRIHVRRKRRRRFARGGGSSGPLLPAANCKRECHAGCYVVGVEALPLPLVGLRTLLSPSLRGHRAGGVVAATCAGGGGRGRRRPPARAASRSREGAAAATCAAARAAGGRQGGARDRGRRVGGDWVRVVGLGLAAPFFLTIVPILAS